MWLEELVSVWFKTQSLHVGEPVQVSCTRQSWHKSAIMYHFYATMRRWRVILVMPVHVDWTRCTRWTRSMEGVRIWQLLPVLNLPNSWARYAFLPTLLLSCPTQPYHHLTTSLMQFYLQWKASVVCCHMDPATHHVYQRQGHTFQWILFATAGKWAMHQNTFSNRVTGDRIGPNWAGIFIECCRALKGWTHKLPAKTFGSQRCNLCIAFAIFALFPNM